MKMDFSTVLVSLEGKPIKESDAPDSKDVTLGFIAVQALLGTMKGDDALGGEDKLKLYQIAEKVADSRDKKKQIDIGVEDVAKIKERVGKMFGTAIVGPVFKLIG